MAENREMRTPATRYGDPFEAFRTEMDKLTEAFFGRGLMPSAPSMPSWAPSPTGFVMPSVDLKEDDGALVLTAELPGMAEDDVELAVRDGMLILKGEKRHSYEDKKDDVHVMERRYGTVQRAFRLPDNIDPEQITAGFANGVLTVTLPKRAGTTPQARKIDIGR